MHRLEKAVRDTVDQANNGTLKYNEALINEFGEKCKASLVDALWREEEDFRLRMSNIGKPSRWLWLEKKFGRTKPNAEFVARMMYGYLIEHLFVTLIKFQRPNIKTDVECSAVIGGQKIKGALDIMDTDEETGEEEIYDFKSASPYSYDNKFSSFDNLIRDDGFGYQGQGIGYGHATNTRFGGWFAVNKSNGDFRVVTTPVGYGYEVWKTEVLENVQKTINEVTTDTPPECTEIVDEAFYGKPTGNKIVGGLCKFCPNPAACHPNSSLEPSRVSKAKFPKWERYID